MRKTAREDGYFAATEAYQRYPFEFDKRLPFRLHIGLYPPDSIKRDLDNIVAALKSYQDGVFEYLGYDDSEIRRRSAIMHPPRIPGGMVYYILYQLGG
jgi:Holliday junction resolvase RusA-like endonuclease